MYCPSNYVRRLDFEPSLTLLCVIQTCYYPLASIKLTAYATQKQAVIVSIKAVAERLRQKLSPFSEIQVYYILLLRFTRQAKL